MKKVVWGLPERWIAASELTDELCESFALPSIHADFISLTESLVVILDNPGLEFFSSAAAASLSFLPAFFSSQR